MWRAAGGLVAIPGAVSLEVLCGMLRTYIGPEL